MDEHKIHFVWMGGPQSGVALSWSSSLRLFWRTSGAWGVGFKMVDGQMISTHERETLNGHVLTPCTEEEWRKNDSSRTKS